MEPSPISDEVVADRFCDLAQQKETSIAGIWLFLATEVMFFGGLFAAYFVCRFLYPRTFTEFSHELNVFKGTLNTAVLLTSSLTMALGVRAIESGKRKKFFAMFGTTFTLGGIFLFIKLSEWYQEFLKGFVPVFAYNNSGNDPAYGKLFFSLYFLMTGLHGIHVLIGMCLILIIGGLALRSGKLSHFVTRIEVLGLYWHFVDLIWIFLYPCFYLIGRS